jgi:signal peptidase II
MPKRVIWFASCAALVMVGDQTSKFWSLKELTYAFDAVPSPLAVFFAAAPKTDRGNHFANLTDVVWSPNFFRFRYAENPGAAFGLFRTVPESLRGPLFLSTTLAAAALLVLTMKRVKGLRSEKWLMLGLPLILGGALGNAVDRVARGFVIDFIEIHYYDKAYWPAFNIADAAICIGVAALLIDSVVRKEPKASV